MILSVSTRTDISALYSDWFMNRYAEGFVDVRNPFNRKLVNRIYFDNVDLIFFCTKNPIPILDKIEKIKKPIIFHITLTPYKMDIEPFIKDKKDIIEAIKRLAIILGSERVVVRYDPIFINEVYTLNYHIRAFSKICNLLSGYVNKILISFIDDYKNVSNNRRIINYKKLTEEDYKMIGCNFSEIAKKNNIVVHTCFEDRNLIEYGFVKDDCLSQKLAFEITGKIYKIQSARKEKKCNCVQMVDIGSYNSCSHFCKYCYANYNEKEVLANKDKHNPKSSLLIGELEDDDIIKERIR